MSIMLENCIQFSANDFYAGTIGLIVKKIERKKRSKANS